ncbi:MAG: aspartate-semialdehyde dehydrogenase [Elusimicrobia bacterium]|nr:aspartate-semialdehyde dehydrogenase [Elusimicrobiota bacterium]MDE2510060.1 aspartate-semialdehyde dehydrogenase [Elusimicrobiota bacterium]
MRSARKGLRVGVVGATGMVGRELVELLERRRFPAGELLPFSSGRARASVRFRGRAVAAPGTDAAALETCDAVFLVSSDEVALEHGPRLAARGVWVIDDSAAFRLDPKVPLVIPEVNAGALRRDRRLIAGPNCTMTGLGVAGALLHKTIGVREVRVASYQAVSGAGKAALAELFGQAAALARTGLSADGRAPVLGAGKSAVLPRAIAYNAIPQVGRFGPDGYSGEETKVAAELRKIWAAPGLKVSATAVRVPTIRGHALSAWLTLARPTTAARARELLARTPGLTLSPDGDYPTPRSAGGKNPVFAGRLRQGATPREIALWISSDNLLKGAALNSVQTAEELLRRGWLSTR